MAPGALRPGNPDLSKAVELKFGLSFHSWVALVRQLPFPQGQFAQLRQDWLQGVPRLMHGKVEGPRPPWMNCLASLHPSHSRSKLEDIMTLFLLLCEINPHTTELPEPVPPQLERCSPK